MKMQKKKKGLIHFSWRMWLTQSSVEPSAYAPINQWEHSNVQTKDHSKGRSVFAPAQEEGIVIKMYILGSTDTWNSGLVMVAGRRTFYPQLWYTWHRQTCAPLHVQQDQWQLAPVCDVQTSSSALQMLQSPVHMPGMEPFTCSLKPASRLGGGLQQRTPSRTSASARNMGIIFDFSFLTISECFCNVISYGVLITVALWGCIICIL